MVLQGPRSHGTGRMRQGCAQRGPFLFLSRVQSAGCKGQSKPDEIAFSLLPSPPKWALEEKTPPLPFLARRRPGFVLKYLDDVNPFPPDRSRPPRHAARRAHSA